jgi:hypothetical protein
MGFCASYSTTNALETFALFAKGDWAMTALRVPSPVEVWNG